MRGLGVSRLVSLAWHGGIVAGLLIPAHPITNLPRLPRQTLSLFGHLCEFPFEFSQLF